jgi:hypothetical protein
MSCVKGHDRAQPHGPNLHSVFVPNISSPRCQSQNTVHEALCWNHGSDPLYSAAFVDRVLSLDGTLRYMTDIFLISALNQDPAKLMTFGNWTNKDVFGKLSSDCGIWAVSDVGASLIQYLWKCGPAQSRLR